jgi:predicted flap endonuclease-1-like 5' DNA nuclease
MAQTTKDDTCVIVCWGLAGLSGLGLLIILNQAIWFLVALAIGLAFAVWFGLLLQKNICGVFTAPWEGQSLGELTGMEKLSPQRMRELGMLEDAPAPAPAPRTAAPAPAPAPKPAPAAKAEAAPKPAETTAKTGADKAAPTAGMSESPGKKPEALEKPRGDGPDDLKKIKGVGPKLEKLLHSLGFFHFDQIAGWTADEVAWVDENLEGFKGRVTRDDWVAQAKTLAAGGETEFSKRK